MAKIGFKLINSALKSFFCKTIENWNKHNYFYNYFGDVRVETT